MLYILRWFTQAYYYRTFIHSFADIFESLGATLNVAKPTKGSSVAKFLTGVIGKLLVFFKWQITFLFCFFIHISVNLPNDIISFGKAAEGARIVLVLI